MSYITINQLPDAGTLQSTDHFLVSDSTKSYKVTLASLNQIIIDLNARTVRAFTNVTLADVTNTVSADNTHIIGIPTQDIAKGVPCVVIGDEGTNTLQISAASGDDTIQGFTSTDLLQNTEGLIVSSGIISFDLTAFPTAGALYWQLGELTKTPNHNIRRQLLGYILIGGASGKLLISDLKSLPVASDVGYFNQNSGIASTELQGAIDEIITRVDELENSSFVQANIPTYAVTEGDTWYDTSTETYNIYREFPVNSGTFSWEPVVYHNNDVLDGGSW